MKKKMSREDWEEYAKSKTVTCAVSGTSMEKTKTITQLSKKQLEDMCMHLMNWNHEQVHRANELEDRIERAIEYINNNRRADLVFKLHLNEDEVDKLLEILRGNNGRQDNI